MRSLKEEVQRVSSHVPVPTADPQSHSYWREGGTQEDVASMVDSEKTLQEELLDALQIRARNSIDLEFRPSFNIRAWLDSGVRPSWVPPVSVTINGKANIKPPEWVALSERIATAYELAKVDFTRAMTAAAAEKIGPRNRRVEHIVLTSETVTIKDALALVWHRHRATVRR